MLPDHPATALLLSGACCASMARATAHCPAPAVLYFGDLHTVRPGPAVLIALLEPLTAAVLAALLLGDRLGGAGIAGALLVATAVVLCRRQ